MKIALLTLDKISSRSVGGSDKVFFNMARSLPDFGHDIFALTPNAEDLAPESSGTNFICDNSKKNTLKSLVFNDRVNKLRSSVIFDRSKRRSLRARWDLLRISDTVNGYLKKYQPDIIVSYQQEATYLLLEILKVTVPVITMIHRAAQEYFEKPESSMYKKALEHCAAVQVLMPEYVEQARTYIPNAKVFYIPNVVPQYEECASLDNPVILHSGRVTDIKRQHLIVEAFDLIKDHFPEWKVEFWGPYNSDYAQMLQKTVLEKNLQERVLFCGKTDCISDKLKNASIFVFPSKFEGFSLALTEAMSMGLPAVGCINCPSVNTLIKDDVNGYLCEDNPLELSKKMSLLMESTSLRKRLGSRAREDMKQFSSSAVWSQWNQLLEKIYSEN